MNLIATFTLNLKIKQSKVAEKTEVWGEVSDNEEEILSLRKAGL